MNELLGGTCFHMNSIAERLILKQTKSQLENAYLDNCQDDNC